MKNKYLYSIIAIQTLVMIACILFSILKVEEANQQRAEAEQQKVKAELERKKSEEIMLQYYELQKEFHACCQR